MNTDVLIVGAGAAGLMAARELSKTGKKVIILEARDRVGGRIYPLDEKDFGYSAQGGAEFVHGDAPLTKGLVTEAGLTLTNPTEWWSVLDGTPRILDRISPNDPVLVEKLVALKEDISVGELFDTYLPGEEHAVLRDYVFKRIEGYEAADPYQASAFALRDEVVEDALWQQHNLKEGYGALISFLERECKKEGVEIYLNHVVNKIDYSTQDIQVECANDEMYKAKKAIITVPLPLLEIIDFTPAIPSKIKAVSQIGFGKILKILLRFKTRWWTGELEENFERLFFMFSGEEVPTWWTQYPELYPTLTGWAAASRAANLSQYSDTEIIDRALQSLSNIFKVNIDTLRNELVTSKVVNWQKDPFARGAYSYVTPTSIKAVEELSKPLTDKVFFAGEAMSQEGVASTVEGALASGQEVAKKILANI